MATMSEFGFKKNGYMFTPKDNTYISFFSDTTHPLLGILPKDKTVYKICVVISENSGGSKTFKYLLKNSINGNNGVVYESPDIQIPAEFRNRSSDNVLNELGANIDANLEYLWKNHKKDFDRVRGNFKNSTSILFL
jgi:hypothetical protein